MMDREGKRSILGSHSRQTQVEAVVAACQLQQAHLAHIAGHLPAYLPSLRSPEVGAGVVVPKENARGGANMAVAAAGGGNGGAAAAKKQRAPAPRRWVLRAWRRHFACIVRSCVGQETSSLSRGASTHLHLTSPRPALLAPPPEHTLLPQIHHCGRAGLRVLLHAQPPDCR